MESLDIILGDLQDMHTNIDLYAINSDVNALSSALSHKINCLEADEILNNDLIISIGGDGTMLQSAKLAHKLNIPKPFSCLC